jgi:D-inositol-3-phosphate glycosyltransferase
MMNLRLAVLSVHTCPLAPLGGWETGGMNVYVREVSRELASRGVQVDVFTRRQNTQTPDVVEFAPGARVIHLEAGPPRAIDKYEVIEYLPEFACGVQRFRMLTGRRYDLIHAHYWLSMRPARQFRALWQVPLVAQFHTLAPLKNRVAHDDAEREFRERLDLERAALADADRVIALSRTDRRQMVEHYGAEAEQIEVIPGGVDLSRFRPGSRGAARAVLGLPDRDAVLLFVGRIQRLKGIEVLLRAAAELAEPGRLARPLRVLIVGGQAGSAQQRGPEQAELARLQDLARRLGIERIVQFVGAVDQPRLPLYYRAADVTVMPSSYESFGLVAAESMACGTPVVASQVGGLRSLVQDDQTGYLIPWRHPHLFAERIGQIVSQPALAERLGHGAVESMQQLSWGATADSLLELYTELADRKVSALETRRAGRPGSS